jgi:hypothetical protein
MSPRTLNRLAALFVLGLALFLPPLVNLPREGTVFGVPAPFAWLFLAWGGLIAGLAWVVERGGDRRGRILPPPVAGGGWEGPPVASESPGHDMREGRPP